MSPSGYASHQQTRQQLDELDALLQRMLSLPMSGPAGAGESSALETNPEAFAPLPPALPSVRPAAAVRANGVHAWRVELPPPVAQLVSSPPTADDLPMAISLESAPAVPPPKYTPPPLEPRFFAPPPQPSSQAYIPPTAQPPFNQRAVLQTVIPTAEIVPSVPAMASSAIPAPQWQMPKTTQPAGVPFLLWPLVLMNWTFDLFTYLLGPLGGWLRRPVGRNILGWLGIVMFFGAAGWAAADWFGVEWPR